MKSSSFYFNRAFKVKKSDGIKTYQNSKKCISTSASSCPRQQFVYLTLRLCAVVGPSKNWVEAKIIRVEGSRKWNSEEKPHLQQSICYVHRVEDLITHPTQLYGNSKVLLLSSHYINILDQFHQEIKCQ